MSLESPCAPTVSRTLSEMLQLISKAAARPGHAGVRQGAATAKQRQGRRNAVRWGEFAALGRHTHTYMHTHPWLLQVVVQRETWPAVCVGSGGRVWELGSSPVLSAGFRPPPLLPVHLAFGSFSLLEGCGLPHPSSHPGGVIWTLREPPARPCAAHLWAGEMG